MGTNVKENNQKCPECGGYLISNLETGETVCSQCGLITEERMVDYSHSGRRAFTATEKSSREHTGSPISVLIPDIGLTTTIDKRGIANPDLKRAAKWNTRMSWDKRNLLIATTELKRISTNLNLPDHVKKEAMRLYIKAFEKKLLRGRSINSMIAACLYFACRKKKIPRTFQEILDETSENPKDVRRCYAILIKEFHLKVPSADPVILVPRFITELDLDAEIERITVKILKAYKKRIPLSGKDPKGIVAGALYLACKIKKVELTQKAIVDTIGVTEVTLRSRYKEIIKKLKIKLPE
ncbi:MAG: transcription initiation factor IIB [Candidatus Lokiarchaeota archaeon]|nr:transcription initiation factor IIB [Candidatus Lokiarchaeota archaeon]MBD3338213.1 transcription initiation factor IIB [Candidatus Lokiarchaeota archaeon]